MTKLVDIEGVGEAYAQKLEAAGVATQEVLLQMGSTPKGRKDIAEKSGITEKLILGWVNRVDLARIKGIGEEYADLLEAAGVDTVPELAQRKPENLYQKLVEMNEAKKLVRQLPTEAKVADWVITRAVGAALGFQGDLGEALGALLGGRVRRGFLAGTLDEGLHGEHHKVEDRQRYEHEGEQSVEERPIHELAAVDSEVEGGEVVLTEDGGNERGDEVGHESGDQHPERGPDHDAYGQVDHVAAQ
jgi:predicted flap endonuclease-1-like 5' DNA nuclease